MLQVLKRNEQIALSEAFSKPQAAGTSQLAADTAGLEPARLSTANTPAASNDFAARFRQGSCLLHGPKLYSGS